MAKLQVWNESTCVAWLWSDGHTVAVEEDFTMVTHPDEPPLTDYGMTSQNSTLYEGVTDVPDDWDYDKYRYDGSSWSLNPNWTAPEGE